MKKGELSMKKGMLLIFVVLLGTVGLAQAQEDKLGVTLDVTYVSRYIWRGFDAYSRDHSAIQPSIDIDFYGTGLGLNVWMSRANRSGFENSEWLTYTLSYNNWLFEDGAYATNYTMGWVYYSYPDEPRKGTTPGTGAAQEIFTAFAWPKICPMGVVPSYIVVAYWPSEGDSASKDNAGWAHIFGLDYGLAVPGFLPETEEQILNLHAEAVYNDGAGPAGKAVDHDWSHAVFGISTDFNVAENLVFTPGLYYQSSWDDGVNTSDESWVSLSMKYKF